MPPLQKQSVPIDFSQGMDTKTDPNQLPIGRFKRLKNMVFNKFKRLQKRPGFDKLFTLSSGSDATTLTTFHGNLITVGNQLQAFSESSETMSNQGTFEPLALSTQTLVRSNTTQTQCDAVVAPNGLVCTVFTDVAPSGTTYQYTILEGETSQVVKSPTAIATAAGSPKVWVVGNYFVIVFKSTTANHLSYIAISSLSPTSVTAATDLSTSYLDAGTSYAFEGSVINNSLYLAWNGNDGGGAIRITSLDSYLTQHSTKVIAGKSATLLSVCGDTTVTSPVVWVTWYTTTGPRGYTTSFDLSLNPILATTQILNSDTVLNLTTAAFTTSGITQVLRVFCEVSNTYSYGTTPNTNYIRRIQVAADGTVAVDGNIRRSVGLASKAFVFDGTAYVLAVYNSPYQPTYFLLKSGGTIIAKLAYSNASGYLTKGLPNVSFLDSNLFISYLIKDLLEPINRTQGSANSLGVYAQVGINGVTFDFTDIPLSTAETGNNLHLSGGIVWAYDGYTLAEQGFHLWPDYVTATWSAAGGSIAAKPDGATNTNAYFYQCTYEWTDNQGNIFRSAPSIPLAVTTTGVGTTGSITVNVPTLRMTGKLNTPVKIVIYRWSVAQQTYYQVTSITTPTLSSITTDSVTFVDILADASIIGNSILYTTGGVVENIGPPAANAMSLYKSRLFLIDAEDKNLLWYSKTILEGTPVEMSDLFTIFVAPTIGAQGSTGDLECLFPLDDKLILFKPNAIYYLVGSGPDATGANNDFNDPVFVTATVGCSNQRSIVFTPLGLLFQSDKGLWLLSRDLSTTYLGAPVEDFNGETVLSANTIPGTNQVRFTMSGGKMLMYDYFFNQWGTFEGIPGVSSTLYQNRHTVLNQYGQILQESLTNYQDDSRPTLLGFTTGWINAAGLQGYERAYFFYLLGEYVSPHLLMVSIAYDYNENPTQSTLITPDNFSPNYGDDQNYGSSDPFGGPGRLEQWRVFFEKQKCQAFQISIDEVFDPSLGTSPGAGLTLSGLDLIIGVKSGYPRLPASRSVG